MECGGGGDLVSWEWRFWQGGASVARGRRKGGEGGGWGEEEEGSPGSRGRPAGWRGGPCLEGGPCCTEGGSKEVLELKAPQRKVTTFIKITWSDIVSQIYIVNTVMLSKHGLIRYRTGNQFAK